MSAWDPIGIRGIAAAEDEYDSYIPKIAEMLVAGTDLHKLTRHLHNIETVAMGRTGVSLVANKLPGTFSVCYGHS